MRHGTNTSQRPEVCLAVCFCRIRLTAARFGTASVTEIIDIVMAWQDVKSSAKGPTDFEVRQVVDYVRRNAKPRFYADENFPTAATALLRRRKADVLTVAEARRRGHPDENHAAEALRLGRALITCDRDYLDERKFPLIHCPAIVICHFGKGSVREIHNTFYCLWGIFTAPQFFDKWVKIDASYDCWTEHTRYLDGSTSHTRFRIFSLRLQEWVSGNQESKRLHDSI